MPEGHYLAERLVGDSRECVGTGKGGTRASCWTDYRVLHVRLDIRIGYRRIGRLVILESPLLSSSVDLAQVTEACIHLRLCSGMDKVGNRDGSQ